MEPHLDKSRQFPEVFTLLFFEDGDILQLLRGELQWKQQIQIAEGKLRPAKGLLRGCRGRLNFSGPSIGRSALQAVMISHLSAQPDSYPQTYQQKCLSLSTGSRVKMG